MSASRRRIFTYLSLPVMLPVGGTGAADLITAFPLGDYSGRIVSWHYVTRVVGTGAGATRTFNLEINSTDITGSAGTLALADTDALGEVKAMGVPTALNEFRAGDTLSIEVASGGTTFTAGAGAFIVRIEQKL